MYGIFTYMLFICTVNVGKYTVRPIDPSWDIAPTNELIKPQKRQRTAAGNVHLKIPGLVRMMNPFVKGT